MSTATSEGSRVNLGAAAGFKVGDGRGQNMEHPYPSGLDFTDSHAVHHVNLASLSEDHMSETVDICIVLRIRF